MLEYTLLRSLSMCCHTGVVILSPRHCVQTLANSTSIVSESGEQLWTAWIRIVSVLFQSRERHLPAESIPKHLPRGERACQAIAEICPLPPIPSLPQTTTQVMGALRPHQQIPMTHPTTATLPHHPPFKAPSLCIPLSHQSTTLPLHRHHHYRQGRYVS